MKRSISLFSLVVAGALAQLVSPMAAAQPGAPSNVEEIHLRPNALPDVNLTGEMLYRLLAAEFSAQRGDPGTAAQLFYQVARDTSDPRLAKRAFQFSMVARNFALANQAAQLWVLVAPEDPEAVASSLALSASNGQTAGMASALWSRIEKAPNKEVAIGQAAAIVSKLNDKRAAYRVLDSALREPVRSLAVTWLTLADAAWAAGNPEQALKHAQKAQSIDPDSEPAAQRLLEYGLKVDPAAAIESAQAFLKRHPQTDRLGLMLVSRLAESGKIDAALAQIHDMRQRAPENFDLLYTEAEVNARAKRYDAAKALLNEYIDVQSQRRESINDKASNAQADASDARLMLVKIAEQQGQLQEAIKQLRLIDDPALVFQARMHEAVLYGRMGNLDQAMATLDRVKPQNNQEASVIAMTRSTIYRDAGRTDMAIKTLEKANTDIPDTSEIKYDLAMMYERQGNFERFEKLMREIIELDPDNANAYNSLGYTLVEQNTRLDEAQTLLDKAMQLEPENPFILDSVGWYFYRTGDNEAALQYLRRSYQGLPAADVAAHLGEVLWALGRKDEAREIWKKGLAHDAKNETLLKTLRRFGEPTP